MTTDSKIAVLGDSFIAAQIKAALQALGFAILEEGELEIQDEWQVKQWMQAQNPTHVFVCVGVRSQTSVAAFLFTTVGSINVLRGAAGIAERVRLVATMPTVEYYQLRRLCELYFMEKGLDFADILYAAREKPHEYFRRCVLSMRDLSAKEAHTRSSQGQKPRGEVHDQVVPQRESGQVHELSQPKRQDNPLREPPAPVLEVPQPPLEGAPSGDVCPQCDPAAGQATEGSLHNQFSPVPGMVP